MRRAAFIPPAMLLRASSSITPVQGARPRVLIITGPTAVGKSATALEICMAINGEIISADSVQVYRGLEVGSNKATAAERERVPHHMLDVADPSQREYSAGDFFRGARAATDDVLRRGRTPVVVGGTMMYVRWFMYGRPATPRAADGAKERVGEVLRSLKGDWDRGLALLAERDPRRAAKLSTNDWYRLGRALEVLETTGVPMSEMPVCGGAPNSAVDAAELDYDFRCVFLYGGREALNRRIDMRCEEMILPRGHSRSIVTEVAGLLCTGGLRVGSAAPSRAIGYRQTVYYLAVRALAAQEQGVDMGAEEAVAAFRRFVEDFQTATRGYAKQQLAWFRKEARFHWVEAGSGAASAVEKLLGLSEAEYTELREVSRDAQREVREGMIAQGREMKTYIARKTWLVGGSDEEAEAVREAERCAEEIAAAVGKEELERIRGVVER